MSAHDGHRERLRSRFIRHGEENFEDINLLELLLFYAIPRADTNLLAHALIERFGSLAAVLEASPQQLMEVPGVGENTAALLRLIPAVSRRYVRSCSQSGKVLDDTQKTADYLIPYFLYETEEVVRALFLDARDHPILCRELSRGVVDTASISPRRLAEEALRCRASTVILVHNHPSGVPLPSREDEETTRQLAAAMRVLGVELRDHMIVAGCDYISMKEIGLLR